MGSACEDCAEPDPNDNGSEMVVLFGDSLSSMSGPETKQRFIDDPNDRLSFNSMGGTELDTQAWVDRYPSVPQGSTVLLFLGTNDITNNSLDQIKAQYRSAIKTVTDAGASRVVTNTINETSAFEFGGQARLDKTRAVNAWLRQADASTHPDYRAFELVDWASVSQGRTDWLAEDGIHHNLEGQAQYANFTHEAAQ